MTAVMYIILIFRILSYRNHLFTVQNPSAIFADRSISNASASATVSTKQGNVHSMTLANFEVVQFMTLLKIISPGKASTQVVWQDVLVLNDTFNSALNDAMQFGNEVAKFNKPRSNLPNSAKLYVDFT